jgi:hypothetical protein
MDAITKADVVDIFKLLATLFPQSAKNYAEAGEFARDAWFEMVKDLPAPLVAAAIKSYASSHVFAPSIAEIRAEVLKASCPELSIGADEAWGMLHKAITKYGYNRPQDAFASLPAPVARCAERMGWRDLCLSEEQDVIRGQFRKAYETQMNREKQDALVPLYVRERLAQLSGAGQVKTLNGGTA